MKIVLVAPDVAISYEDGFRKSPPMGLMSLAANLPADCDVAILDFYNEPAPLSAQVENIASHAPDVVGFTTVFSAMYPSFQRLSRAVKKRIPDVKIVVGGNHATFQCEEILNEELSVDYVVLHEGELALKSLIEHIRGGPFPDYNVANRQRTKPPIQFLSNLDSLQFPILAFDAIKSKDKTHYSSNVMASRGCPNGCIYCSTSVMWQRRTRLRSVASVMAEIQALRNTLGSTNVTFNDDLLTVNKKRTYELCKALKAESVSWGGAARVETVDKPMLEEMKACGCTGLFFGIESGSDRVLRALQRKYSVSDVVRVFTDCRELGIETYGSFIIGLPTETEKDIEETFCLAERLPTNLIRIGPLQVLPGTELWRCRDEYGLSSTGDSWDAVDTDNRAHWSNGIVSCERLTELNRRARLLCQRKMLTG